MKIAVVAANGKAGRLIVEEAVNRGLDVTAIVRGENKTKAAHSIKRDILDIKADDLKNFDVVIDAFGTFDPDTLHLHSETLKVLCDAVSGTQTRLLVVGGAGSLYLDKTHTQQLYKTPDFPKDYRPLAAAQAQELDELRKRKDVKWTFVSPAADFQADAPRTGKYILAGEEFTLNSKGESIISYADYAIAMIDEALNGNHIQQRISVVRE
ncbi:MAG: NAD(P)-dependent oxidoreductase [Synergistaceae bacterium]|nr:NAD(P)-dependent oxidoreductase [Synergistaceae bacterium]